MAHEGEIAQGIRTAYQHATSRCLGTTVADYSGGAEIGRALGLENDLRLLYGEVLESELFVLLLQRLGHPSAEDERFSLSRREQDLKENTAGKKSDTVQESIIRLASGHAQTIFTAGLSDTQSSTEAISTYSTRAGELQRDYQRRSSRHST